jgi:hypothetical protein
MTEIEEMIYRNKNKIPEPFTLTNHLVFETWTPVEAAMLVCGLCPMPDCQEIPAGAMGLDNCFHQWPEDGFHEAKRILKIWNSRENVPLKVRPIDFIEWCKSKGINTDWLREITAETEIYTQADVNNGNDVERIRRNRLYGEILEIPNYKTIGQPAIRKILTTYIGKDGSCVKSISSANISWIDSEGNPQVTTYDSLGKWLTRQKRI